MLQGLLKGQLKLTKKINYYIDLCLKCGACSKFCPSGIDAVDVMLAAKSEVFKNSLFEKTISLIHLENEIKTLTLSLFHIFHSNCILTFHQKQIIIFIFIIILHH